MFITDFPLHNDYFLIATIQFVGEGPTTLPLIQFLKTNNQHDKIKTFRIVEFIISAISLKLWIFY